VNKTNNATSDEMKLLMAMCDAMGFKVEENLDYKEEGFSEEDYKLWGFNTNSILRDQGREFVVSGNGEYVTRLIYPIKSYKVTKL